MNLTRETLIRAAAQVAVVVISYLMAVSLYQQVPLRVTVQDTPTMTFLSCWLLVGIVFAIPLCAVMFLMDVIQHHRESGSSE